MMLNPIKVLRLHWQMRKVKGGFTDGDSFSVADAFARAGMIEDDDRVDFAEYLRRERISKAFLDYVDELGRRD